MGGLYYGKFYKNYRLYYRRLNRFRLKVKNREGILIELSELLEKSPNVTGEEKRYL